MKTHNIAVYAGDGIGIEVTAEVARVLATLEDVFDDVRYEWTEFDWGHRHWAKTGKVVPDDYLATVREFDAIFLGAVGDPAHVPDHITLVPLIEMRQRFDQYVCLRPARLLPGVKSPLADKGEGDIDMMATNINMVASELINDSFKANDIETENPHAVHVSLCAVFSSTPSFKNTNVQFLLTAQLSKA